MQWSYRFRNRLNQLIAVALAATAVAACVSPSVDVAPQRLVLNARPNGIAVRATDGTVFITDDLSNSVLSASEGQAFAHYVSIPTVAGQANSLSQLTFINANTLLIERFGYGSASAIFDSPAPDKVQALLGLDPSRHRLGLALAAPGKLLSSWFVKQGKQALEGGVSLLSYDASTHQVVEHDVLKGLSKPVGIVVADDTVFVSDQTQNRVVRVSLQAVLHTTQAIAPDTVVAQIHGPDLMTLDAAGTLYTKCDTHSLCAIASNGTVTVLANDFQDARGVAVDQLHHRLYAIDRASSASGISYLRSFPLGR